MVDRLTNRSLSAAVAAGRANHVDVENAIALGGGHGALLGRGGGTILDLGAVARSVALVAGRVPKWTKGTDCKSVIRGFESHRGLWGVRVAWYALEANHAGVVVQSIAQEMYLPRWRVWRGTRPCGNHAGGARRAWFRPGAAGTTPPRVYNSPHEAMGPGCHCVPSAGGGGECGGGVGVRHLGYHSTPKHAQRMGGRERA